MLQLCVHVWLFQNAQKCRPWKHGLQIEGTDLVQDLAFLMWKQRPKEGRCPTLGHTERAGHRVLADLTVQSAFSWLGTWVPITLVKISPAALFQGKRHVVCDWPLSLVGGVGTAGMRFWPGLCACRCFLQTFCWGACPFPPVRLAGCSVLQHLLGAGQCAGFWGPWPGELPEKMLCDL